MPCLSEWACVKASVLTGWQGGKAARRRRLRMPQVRPSHGIRSRPSTPSHHPPTGRMCGSPPPQLRLGYHPQLR